MICIKCKTTFKDYEGYKFRKTVTEGLCFKCEKQIDKTYGELYDRELPVEVELGLIAKVKYYIFPRIALRARKERTAVIEGVNKDNERRGHERHSIFEEFEPLFQGVWDYPPDWQWRRKQVMDRDNYICQRCGRKLWGSVVPAHVHHVIPRSLIEGDHKLDNLVLLCEICHSKIDTPGHQNVHTERQKRLKNRRQKDIKRFYGRDYGMSHYW